MVKILILRCCRDSAPQLGRKNEQAAGNHRVRNDYWVLTFFDKFSAFQKNLTGTWCLIGSLKLGIERTEGLQGREQISWYDNLRHNLRPCLKVLKVRRDASSIRLSHIPKSALGKPIVKKLVSCHVPFEIFLLICLAH